MGIGTGFLVLLYSRCAEEPSPSLLGQFIKLRNASKTSLPSIAHCLSTRFARYTAHSARPFDCAYLGLEVTCSSPRSLLSFLNSCAA